ncbi:hypothetical protein [Fuerstiella marisgermanici]|uniref:Uncharacterized protein n=1 Tax=Fuerstiella marisgermanici TaxID=1891926 RepID=A0A1P8WH24_9PLAN|nr:hypothetical protein [Fuerstiella marisgermanici]APZ93369.1 hypothetical protein Fuma_02986 [Fuerstiella marisgermanici]
MANLGVCSSKWEIGTPTSAVSTLRTLSEDEFKSYMDASTALGRFARKRHLFQIVELNRDAFHDCLRTLGSEFEDDTAISWDRANTMILTVNGHILNFLSAVRTFLDHTETNIKREYGDPSDNLTNFKKQTAEEFDDCFSYRFLYLLRNFTQHCGMPLGELSLRADARPGTERPDTTLELLFYRDHLLTNFSNWKMVKTELEQLEEKFPVTQHVDEMVTCLERVDSVVIRDDAPQLSPHVATLEAMVQEVSHLSGAPCVLTEVTPISGGVNMTLQRIQLEQVSMVKSLLASHT